MLGSQHLQLSPLSLQIVSRALSTPNNIAGKGVLHNVNVSFNLFRDICSQLGVFEYLDVVGSLNSDALPDALSAFFFTTSVLFHDDVDCVLAVGIILLLLERE